MLRRKVIQTISCIYNKDCIVKANHSPSVSHAKFCLELEAIIDGQTLKWPKFEIRDAVFGGTHVKMKSASYIE
jgi:hypothetical protein